MSSLLTGAMSGKHCMALRSVTCRMLCPKSRKPGGQRVRGEGSRTEDVEAGSTISSAKCCQPYSRRSILGSALVPFHEGHGEWRTNSPWSSIRRTNPSMAADSGTRANGIPVAACLARSQCTHSIPRTPAAAIIMTTAIQIPLQGSIQTLGSFCSASSFQQ